MRKPHPNLLICETTGKHAFRTWTRADQAMRSMRRDKGFQPRGDARLEVYQCQHCDLYHVGHLNPNAAHRGNRRDRKDAA